MLLDVAAAAICAKTVAAIVAPRCFVETFEPLDDLVSPSVAGFVATPAVGIVVTVSVVTLMLFDRKPEVQSQDQVLEGVTNGLWLLFGNDEKLG